MNKNILNFFFIQKLKLYLLHDIHIINIIHSFNSKQPIDIINNKLYYLKHRLNSKNSNLFQQVCILNDRYLLNSFISETQREDWNWNWGLVGACRGGHMDLAQLMIEQGATNWDLGFCY